MTTQWPGRESKSERIRIVTKLISLFPTPRDPVVTHESYVQELGKIPCFWLSRACRSLADDPDRTWLPRPGHIKVEAARLFSTYRHRQQFGLPYDPRAIHRRLGVGREIHLMQDGPIEPERQLSAGSDPGPNL